MGNLCSCCTGQPKEADEDRVKMTKVSKMTEGERAKMTEAQAKAGLAAQQRLEVFEKSPVGRAAKKAAVEAAKPTPVHNRGEPALRWQVG